MVNISFEQAALLGKNYRAVPVSASIPAGGRTPADVFLILKNLSKHCFILESAEDETRYGRYTFIGYDPKMEITAENGNMSIKSYAEINLREDNPARRIKEILRDNTSPKVDGLPPFTGGLVGYFSYDYIKYAEPSLTFSAEKDDVFKDVDLMLFDKIVAFDHLKDTIILIVNARTDGLSENYNRAVSDIEKLAHVIESGKPYEPKKLRILSPFRPRHSKGEYCGMVTRAKDYIHEGDIFQVVLSNRYDAEAEGSLFETFQILRESNPSPYMLYFSSDDIEIAGSAPETLVSVTDGVISTFPLAGTRPRGATRKKDKELEDDLLRDEKELAEHNMLVDLGRNDIGKISEFGSVEVEKYMEIERFSHVMHIGSKVTGKLREGFDAVDAVGALLPAGTLSGAPKIRACQIIDELEQCHRGIYGGAIGYLAFNGDMDVCIAIRLAYKKNNRVYVRSGAGIVADSVPETEYKECLNKMKAVTNALKKASGGEKNDSAD
ncbi:MAG: anthranilate synthase component I family protein [Oscillospiraceae bacterium]|jgi:anthranilate synthase component 1|nr:anthranilate synthase component I family protein [Oscillospiraceae bacterium]